MTEAGRPGVHPVVPAFGPAAAEYERGRPEYPAEVGTTLARELRLGPGTRVCDLGAGTGKFTRTLVALGCDVVAVEPVAGMREQLDRLLVDVEVLDGTAESIPLPDGSVDSVTVAQAFHWFDLPVAFAEIHRVLRDDGGLALVWNMRDESVPWVAEMSRIIEWKNRDAARYQTIDWAAEVAASGRFGRLHHHELAWDQLITRDRLEDRVRSISYIAASLPADADRMVAEVLGLVDGRPEPFPFPYRTHVFWCHRR
jgi:SAM-dependent methyltransferase